MVVVWRAVVACTCLSGLMVWVVFVWGWVVRKGGEGFDEVGCVWGGGVVMVVETVRLWRVAKGL